MVGDKFNMKDTFFRDLTVSVLDKFESQIRWVNRFSSGDVSVIVPFFYSLTGDERFLMDAFVDDVVSCNRFTEFNTDRIPRGHITMSGIDILSDEFANPNVWLKNVIEEESELRSVLTKIRAIPMSIRYSTKIILSSEQDVFNAQASLLDTLWLYNFLNFEFNGMYIDAVIMLPDSNQININREINIGTDNSISIDFDFEVQTYYPAFRKDNLGDANNRGSSNAKLPTRWNNIIE